jgi:small subunit ribosomal protein S6e
MRKDLPGMIRKRLLLSKSKGFNSKENGLRRKKSVRGNTINQEIVQINLKVKKYSTKPIDKLIVKEEKDDKKEERK